MKPIPIHAARSIAEQYGYDQVIIVARKVGPDGGEHVTTYGRDKAHCDVAARCGNFLKYKVMGWHQEQAPELETGTALCPHGMPLAENICGPCSEGRLNATPDDLGFGVPVLRDMALELMRRNGLSKEEAITEVAHDAELRSEAIEALRRALNR